MARIALALLLGTCVGSAGADVPYVNWENHPVHALDLSPDGRTLAVAHTADQRVQLFDVTTGTAIAAGHVVVGVDPVSVRFRADGELWVVNHVSDSVSVVDVARRAVRSTLATADEPYDVVFANGRAFVSCSQANQVLVFDPADLAAAPAVVAIDAEDPRALAVGADGRTVYAAIFESGNATTLLAGGLVNDVAALPNAVSDPRGPYGGRNPPPNAGNAFVPPLDPTAPPPRVGLIVRKGADGRWRDDNAGDWTAFVTGPLASASGRRTGWDLPDRDLALIDTATLAVRYVSGLMNVGMALAVHPTTGEATLVGTDATNEVRFEPNVSGRFVRVELARAGDAAKTIVDLNPHLDYRAPRVAPSERERSIGDPRAIVWRADGERGWVAGLGSNNVVAIDAQGQRVGAPIAVGAGPAALALDAARNRLYVWNHFEASLSVVDAEAGVERERVAVFDPLPAAIRAGRPLLYDTHRTSGLGQAACASCHVDARMDRLAWDLGDPSAPPAPFDQNCVTSIARACEAFHAMKGPMTTQTLQDIVGHEPFHWRGDRAGLEAFNPAFEGLLGDDRPLDAAEMQAFEDFLATIAFPPNPYRNLDNTLPASVPLDGHYTSGRFALAGQPLGTGNALRGLELYTRGLLDAPFHCASCHTLPTGMAVNGPLMLGFIAVSAGGTRMATGPFGENHLGVVSVDGSTNVSIKVPHLRNQYEKVGFETTQLTSRAGFGFLHDGSVDSLSRFMAARTFSVQSDRDVADLVALTLAFSGSDFPAAANPLLGAPAPASRDTHAAVGAQVTVTSPAANARLDQLLALARLGAVDLIARSAATAAAYERGVDQFRTTDGLTLGATALASTASATSPVTYTAVPAGLGRRLGVDRDGDGVLDGVEIAQGSNPADAASTTLRGRAGLWYDPQRSGHGMDLQYLGANQFATWYTYADDGTPTWYQAAGPIANPWTATLNRFTWNPATGFVDVAAAGTLTLTFDDARRVRFDWRLGARSGSERMVPLIDGAAMPLPDRTGTWYDTDEPGWGLTLYTNGAVRVSVLYFYDGDNQPRWALAQDANTASASLALASYRGFCPDCAATPPTPSDAGTLTLAFDGARRATATTDAFVTPTGAHWRRGPTAIVPLSEPALRPETP